MHNFIVRVGLNNNSILALGLPPALQAPPAGGGPRRDPAAGLVEQWRTDGHRGVPVPAGLSALLPFRADQGWLPGGPAGLRRDLGDSAQPGRSNHLSFISADAPAGRRLRERAQPLAGCTPGVGGLLPGGLGPKR